MGSSIADKATVSGGQPDQQRYRDLQPVQQLDRQRHAACSPTPRPWLSGSTATATSPGYTATATGTDYWVATYNGDSNNTSVTSGTAAEPVTITPATPTINTSQQPASATVGTSIADKATVTGGQPQQQRTVTFNLYNNSRRGSGTPLVHRRR